MGGRRATAALLAAAGLLALIMASTNFSLRELLVARSGRFVPQPRPNVILISIDSLRADHLGAYGYGRATSPSLDRLARQGVVFENAISTTTWTLPAHISMLTSLYPVVHGVTRGKRRLSENAVLLPGLLKKSGFATAAVVSGPFMRSIFGYGRGFDVYDDETARFGSHRASHSGVTSPAVHRKAVEQLEMLKGEPFFLFLHYWDVHYDYIPPPPFDTMFDPDYEGSVNGENFAYNQQVRPDMEPRDLRHVLALYDGEIAFVDQYIGRLFGYLEKEGLFEQSLIIVTSDHGDEFFEHRAKGHRKNLHGVTLRVPLLVKFPHGRWQGRRVSSLVGVVDIAPTILDLMAQEVPPVFGGRSLLPVIKENRGSDTRPYFSSLRGKFRSVQRGRWKLITRWSGNGPVLLFDIEKDPLEQENLAEANLAEVERLEQIQRRWSEAVAELQQDLESQAMEYPPELKEELEGLGYID